MISTFVTCLFVLVLAAFDLFLCVACSISFLWPQFHASIGWDNFCPSSSFPNMSKCLMLLFTI